MGEWGRSIPFPDIVFLFFLSFFFVDTQDGFSMLRVWLGFWLPICSVVRVENKKNNKIKNNKLKALERKSCIKRKKKEKEKKISGRIAGPVPARLY